MRMLEPNATSNNSSVLNTPTNAAGSLNNGAAGLLQNGAGPAPMQTTLNSTATGKFAGNSRQKFFSHKTEKILINLFFNKCCRCIQR